MPVEGESAETAGISIRAAVAAAATTLASAGVASPRVDAELLAAHLLGLGRGQLILAPALTAAQVEDYTRLVAARARRIPLQHLTGVAPFRYLDLAVGPGVFIPRPETELLVEWGLGGLCPAAVVVDLCSGSGAIALAVASEHATAVVYAVEADPAALPWLAGNVARCARLGGQVTIVAGDAGAPAVLSSLDGTVDLVLCNPPYVPVSTVVPAEVAGHDPAVAVFGGADGLDVIRRVVARAGTLLRPGGRVGIEHDQTHGRQVLDLFQADGRYSDLCDHRDLAGQPRFATAVLAAGRRDTTDPGLADWRL